MKELAMKTIADILPVVNASAKDIENWISRLDLSTEYEETVRGRARRYSRVNTLELAFIAALVRGGAAPSKAAAYARTFVHGAQHWSWQKSIKQWLIFTAGDLNRGIGSDTMSNLLAYEEELGSETLTTVNVWKIIKRVNALYEWVL
jgi:hypothetical protein